jgi:hypothetical protein
LIRSPDLSATNCGYTCGGRRSKHRGHRYVVSSLTLISHQTRSTDVRAVDLYLMTKMKMIRAGIDGYPEGTQSPTCMAFRVGDLAIVSSLRRTAASELVQSVSATTQPRCFSNSCSSRFDSMYSKQALRLKADHCFAVVGCWDRPSFGLVCEQLTVSGRIPWTIRHGKLCALYTA